MKSVCAQKTLLTIFKNSKEESGATVQHIEEEGQNRLEQYR